MSQKTRFAGRDLQSLGTFKKLNERLVTIDFQHLSPADLPVILLDFDQLIVLYAFDALHEHQRPDDFFDRLIFL